MIKNLVILAIIAGAGYWYWTNSQPDDTLAAEQKQLDQHAADMRRCIKREQSMNSSAGLGGIGGLGGTAEDMEKLCAEELGLYESGGQWRKLR